MIEKRSLARVLESHDDWPALRARDQRLAAGAKRAVDGAAIAYLDCPRCSGPLARKNFGRVSGVIVDECRFDGTWFDATELSRVLDFLVSDGPRRQAAFEAREAEHIANQKESMRAIDRATEASAIRRGGRRGLFWDYGASIIDPFDFD